MRTRFIFGILLICLFCCFALSKVFASGDVKILVDGKGLSVIKAIERYENVFSGNVLPDEISPEIALDLIKNPSHNYRVLKRKLLKVFFWRLPIKTEWKIFHKEYYSDKGIIRSKLINSGKKETELNFFLDLFLRYIVIAYIFFISFFGFKRKVSKGKILFCYLMLILSIVFTAFFAQGDGAVVFVGFFICGIVWWGWIDRIIFGDGVCGPGVFSMLVSLTVIALVVEIGWQNSGMNQYLIFIFMVCAISFLITPLMKKYGFNLEKENNDGN